MQALTASTINGLVQMASEKKITKENIIAIIERNNQMFLLYE